MPKAPEPNESDGTRPPVKTPRQPSVPWLRTDRPIGLGDALKRATSALGIRPCPGCDRRAAALNQWLVFSSRPTDAAVMNPPATPLGASWQLICIRARIVVCTAIAAVTQFICDITTEVATFICDVFATIAQKVCDAFETISQTVCDVSETVSQTVCDATEQVCNTICDATSWLPWPFDELVCDASHLFCSAVCIASHVVSDVVCTASHIAEVAVCTASHLVSTIVCLVGHIVAYGTCLLGHIIQTVVCIAWGIILGIVCAFVGLLRWLTCLLNSLRHVVFRLRKKPPRVKHVFVLMLENRSFDHMLGFSEIVGPDATTGQPRHIDGVVQNQRFNFDPATGQDVAVDFPADYNLSKADTDPPHEFNYILTQLCYDRQSNTTPAYDPNVGYPLITNDGFVASYEKTDPNAHPQPPANSWKALRCYKTDKERNVQLPIMNALAREFAVCDRWFSSLPGPTWPNRFFIHAASSGGLDDSPSQFQTVTSTLVDGYTFENGTIFDSLDDACIDWQVFHGDSLPQVFAISGMNFNRLRGRLRGFDEFAEHVNDKNYSPAYTFIEPNYGNVLPGTPGDFTCGNSQHPLDDVTRGEKLIKEVYETIRNSPHWENSVLVITYDENGGFYDHVRPPKAAPPGDMISDPANNHHNFAFDQLGVRVPAVVISPLIPRGVVDHNVYDHTSVLATLERLFGLNPLTDRDAVANDLLHLLSLQQPRSDAPTVLPPVANSGFTCEDD